MKTQLVNCFSILFLAGSACMAQEIHPVWVQHLNGLVNVDPTNKLPILVRAGGTGDNTYGFSGNDVIDSYASFVRYDDDHYLLGIRENGIAETSETDPVKLALATNYPDRTVIWIDAHTGRPLGIALRTEINPVPVPAQAPLYAWWKFGVETAGAHGQRAIYTGYRYKILRYAAAGTVPDPNFPTGRPIWSATPSEAWVEPVPGEANPTIPPGQQGTEPGESGGDGSASWRWRAFRVWGGGSTLRVWAGGGTWRASHHAQEFVTDDGGLHLRPIARLNDRGDGGGAKGFYTLGGQPSTIRTDVGDPTRPNLEWCVQTHYPGTGWPARPNRYTKNPDLTVLDTNGLPVSNLRSNRFDATWGTDADAWKARENEPVGRLPAFVWESAGTAGNCPPNHRLDGVSWYDGNWAQVADTKDGMEYIVNYSIPSWDQQFGGVGTNWPTSVDPNSVFKPGWVGLHTLDGKIAPGPNNAWKLPCYETDEPILDPNGNGGTGHDYGYDPNMEVYPGPGPTAQGRSLVLVSFGEYGFGVFAISNTPATGSLVSPSSVSLIENGPLALSGKFIGTGSPLLYEWQKDDGTGQFLSVPGGKGNLAKFGQNMEALSFSIPQAQLSDAGRYRFVAGNSAGLLTSAVATVTVQADVFPPTIESVSSVDGQNVDVRFDERYLTNGPLLDAFNYSINGGAVSAAAVALRPDGRSLRLTALSPPVTGLFTLRVASVQDLKSNEVPVGGILATGLVQGWVEADIGVSELGTNFSALPGVFEMGAVGSAFGGTSDSGHFAYRPQAGDFDVRVQIAAIQRPSRFNGLMVRESVAPDSIQVHATWSPDEKYNALVRASSAGETASFSSTGTWQCDINDPPNVWLRLRRAGNSFTAYGSSDGSTWTEIGATNVAMANSTLLGLAISRGSAGEGGQATFKNFGGIARLNIVRPAVGAIQLSWTGEGTLEAAPNVTGPWSTNGVSQQNPQSVTPSGQRQFYRLR